jgi:triosephosphate isomerase
MTNTPTEADFLVANYGSMMAITPISADANKACDTGVIAYEPWQLMGGSIMVDHRMADDLIQHLRDDGFTIAEE